MEPCIAMRKPKQFDDHPAPFEPPVYRGVCTHVVDGDTFDLMIDLGLYQYAYESVRLAGIDTPEIFRPADETELARGHAAKAAVEALILDQPVLLRTHRDRTTFGRFVADVHFLEGGEWRDLATWLREEGHAKEA